MTTNEKEIRNSEFEIRNEGGMPDTDIGDNSEIRIPNSELAFTRRTFVKVLGAGLLITVAPLELAAQPRRGGGGGRSGGGGQAITIAARVHLGQDGSITVMVGKVEGGQGARAELTQAAAEELGVPADRVQLVMADTGQVPDDGITAGSGSTPRTVPAVRHGAAAARNLLLAFAAAKWGVDRATIQIRDGQATSAGAAGKELTYADLAGDEAQAKALGQAAPADVAVTPVKEWKVLGTPVPRPNGRDLVTGGHRFPSDIVRPGMLYGKVLRPPSYGAKLTAVDLAPAKAMKDVVVVQNESFVGVAAATTFAAEQALAAIAKTATWDQQPKQVSNKNLFDYLRQHAGEIPANPYAADLAAAEKTGGKALRQTYQVAYIQHAPLEPRAAVAEWADGKLTVWVGSQNPFGCQAELARAMGVTADQVRVIVPDFGGGFGGKHQPDAHVEAARLAKAAGKPVQIRWTRAEEFTWAYFRPAALIDAQASLDAKGSMSSWHFININSGGSAVDTPYRVAERKAKCQTVSSDSPLRQGSYRALASTANNFARESFMDELADAAGADPLQFRLAHLDNDRLRAVLERAAKEFGWAERWKQKDPTVGVGLACGTEKGSYVAACVQVAINKGEVVVKQVCQAFECGAILNPANLLSQVQGCILMGLGAALREEMQFENGVITNASFWRYLPTRFADMPQIDVHLLDRPDLTSAGAGETPIMVIAPAIANAVFHATGKRVRQMPIKLGASG